MSIRWMATVWEDATGVEGTELLVLLAIADHAGDDGRAWPSVARLSERTRRSESTVQEALTSLTTKGLIDRTFRTGKSTIYQLLTPPADRTPPVSGPPQPTGPQGSDVPDPIPPVDRTLTVKEPSENRVGAVSEVNSTANSVTESGPFPEWARARLGDITDAEKRDWVSAWRSVDGIAKAWDPVMHLTSYFSYCRKNERRPNPDEWTRWFVKDEHQARTAANVVEDERDSRPWWE